MEDWNSQIFTWKFALNKFLIAKRSRSVDFGRENSESSDIKEDFVSRDHGERIPDDGRVVTTSVVLHSVKPEPSRLLGNPTCQKPFLLLDLISWRNVLWVNLFMYEKEVFIISLIFLLLLIRPISRLNLFEQ